MPIHTDSETGQIPVEFAGGDLIAGLCGNEDGEIDTIGIAEANVIGSPGEIAREDSSGDPAVLLRFHSREALECFIAVLIDYREERFGNGKGA